jgi:hypothetical protein
MSLPVEMVLAKVITATLMDTPTPSTVSQLELSIELDFILTTLRSALLSWSLPTAVEVAMLL